MAINFFSGRMEPRMPDETIGTTQDFKSWPELEELARSRAAEVTEGIAEEPNNYASHSRLLTDLKLAIIQGWADAFYQNKYESIRPPAEFLWNLAQDLPDFNADALYQKRSTLISLAAAVFLGWVLGGFLATFLGFLGLGGEIWRPAAIFCLLWAEEYLAANPRARNIVLAILGLGGLARFAASAAAGLIRFSSFGGWRQAIFGSGSLPNIFKAGWLFFGSFFIFVFLSKKITGLDFTAFQHSLASQIAQRLKLANFVFEQIDERNIALEQYRNKYEKPGSNGKCPKKDCSLALSVLSLLDNFDPGIRHYLTEKLAEAGYSIKSAESNDLIWDNAIHAPIYDTIGLINDGDRFKILRPAYKSGDKLIKGHAQRAAD